MAVLTAARYIVITDALAAVMISAKGASGNGLGNNDTEEPSDDIGARGRSGDLNATIMGYTEDDYLPLAGVIKTAQNRMGYQTWTQLNLSKILQSVDALCVASGASGVTSETGFAAYYNFGGGGPWTCLVAPEYGRGVYYHVNGSYMNAKNVYSPAIATMGSRAYNATFSGGTDVEVAKYAGAAVLKATGSGIAGSGMVTVTGDGRDSTGTSFTGHSWTVEVTGNAAFTLTPSIAGDICTSVTGITIAAGITAGTVTVGAFVPTGRTGPPT